MKPSPNPTRKRVAILTSFTRLGQWRGIMRYGQHAGWICQRHDRDTLPRLRSSPPDGILFQVDEFDGAVLDYMQACELPKVGMRALPGDGGTPLALLDLAEFGRKVATHFLVNNIRRICCLSPALDETANAGSTYSRGILQVAEASGAVPEFIHPDDPETWKMLGLRFRRSQSTGWERFWELGPALLDHLVKISEPVGLFSAYVEPAMELIEMANERGILIPDQICMAAQTEDGLAGSVTRVPLTCIVPDYERQGYEAAATLDRILGGESLPPNYRKLIKTCELVTRESSNKIVTSDPLVRQMLDHIRKHALRFDYTPAALAESFDYSLRFVQIRFRDALRRGVAEVIREHRTAHASELIQKTKLPLQQVVAECGFSDHHQLERAIKKAFGVNPSTLRRNAAAPRK